MWGWVKWAWGGAPAGRGLLAVERVLTSEPEGLLTVLRLVATFGTSRNSGASLGLSFLI